VADIFNRFPNFFSELLATSVYRFDSITVKVLLFAGLT